MMKQRSGAGLVLVKVQQKKVAKISLLQTYFILYNIYIIENINQLIESMNLNENTLKPENH